MEIPLARVTIVWRGGTVPRWRVIPVPSIELDPARCNFMMSRGLGGFRKHHYRFPNKGPQNSLIIPGDPPFLETPASLRPRLQNVFHLEVAMLDWGPQLDTTQRVQGPK